MSSSAGSSDQVQSLVIDVRANTQGFAQDIAAMRNSLDGTLMAGFTQAGGVLEAGIVGAVKTGIAAFSDLRSTALGVINDIAAQATSNFLGSLTTDSGSGSRGTLLGLETLVGAFTGLPGRATGGAVSPGQPYLVGERGPELFVPTSAGSVAANGALGGGAAREVRVAINVNTPAAGDAPQALQRSGRQIASAVRRALTQY